MMIINNNALPSGKPLYTSPEASVIDLNIQGSFCQGSPADGEMRVGDDNW